ncbi:protein of unknown function [Glycomyces sambucus]|uniref:DUF4132 domain-containing protein n=1 Tax=Glycomyces sambucus TaxID=380244 RepID=A0A1G9I552_9ACTN|nr:DUF4132 domain-containing protein [Glycomyces sambucus]SDL20390.1 protein of unknown function [Glycomyces sambucus]
MTEPSPAAPNEDRLVLPARWRRHVLPRRDRDLANANPGGEADPGASAAVAARIAAVRPLVETGIAKRDGDAFAQAMTAHLAGRPDPVGAAALMHVIDSNGKKTVEPQARLRHLDAWAADHGLAFAAVAVLESATVFNWSYATDERRITEAHLSRYVEWEEATGWRAAQPALHRIRALLAAATEEEYRNAVAAVGARRTDPQRCIGSALLMPSEAAWVEEAVDAITGYFEHRRADDWMLWTLTADPRDLHLAKRRGFGTVDERGLAPLVEGVGAGALAILVDLLDRQFDRMAKPARAALLTAIGLLPDDAAAAALIDRLDLPGALTAAMETAARFPQRTLRAVAARAADADPATRKRLEGLVDASPALTAALGDADEAVRTAVAALATARVPDAAPEALPGLLVTPPWAGRRAKATRPVIDLVAPDPAVRMVWEDDEEARRWATLLDDRPYTSYNAEGVRRAVAALEKYGRFGDPTSLLAWARVEDAAPLVARWDGGVPHTDLVELQRILGRFGAEAADRVTAIVQGRSTFTQALLPIRSLAAARIAADRLARTKSAVPHAKRWFARHAEAAAHLLVPDAVGADAGRRRAATVALRYLAAVRGAESVAAAAEPYGEAAATAIGALIAADPLDPLDAKIPKPPAWAVPALLPQVLLKGRTTALPEASVVHLTTVLAIDSPGLPYPGAAVAAEVCDPGSLAAFSRALFERWTDSGSAAKDGWAFTQLAHFANDTTVADLAALVRRWPGQGQHKRAVTGLEVLGAIGSETALRALHAISRKVDFKALKQEAGRQIEAVAERLGLTPDQLADRLVPDFGLGSDAEGASGLLVDYGTRRFTVGFDERLQPFATDETGKPLKSLPKPGAQDDRELADPAYQRFSQLKKDLRTAAKEQVRRLERAMAAQRSWTVPQFGEFFADHPLMHHLARRLVWEAAWETGTGEMRAGFRLAEDSTFAGVEDDAFAPPNGTLVRIAHPATLADLDAWVEIFADYELLQPFPQLSRPVHAFTEEELATGRLARFEGASFPVTRLFPLTAAGWRQGPQNGLWVSPGLHLPLPAGGFVVLALDPGVDGYLGRIDTAQPDQTVRAAYLSDTADYGPGAPHGHPVGTDAVTASEVLGTLARLTGR